MSPPKLKRSYISAAIICAAVAAWVISGGIGRSNQVSDGDGQTLEAPQGTKIMSVRVAHSDAREFTNTVVLRGRTEAFRKVELKAETQGKIAALPVEKGDSVKAGEPICRLDVADRQAQLNEAKALVKQRQLEFEAAQKLSKNGFRSETNVAAAAASFDAAKAQVERMTVELDKTVIRAPFDGVIDDRPVEIGDYLGMGGVCATIIDEDPYLVVGEVAERDVGALKVGSPANVELADGRKITGKLRFVSQSANQITRTFRVEIVVPNNDHSLRDGLSANVRLPVASTSAHLLTPSTLVLGANGGLGVRTVDTASHVKFYPVTVLGEDINGVWVTGLPERADVIVVGQEFVEDGAEVHVVSELARDKG